jgi:hypothetical protein
MNLNSFITIVEAKDSVSTRKEGARRKGFQHSQRDSSLTGNTWKNA